MKKPLFRALAALFLLVAPFAVMAADGDNDCCITGGNPWGVHAQP